jgi:plastocyanin
MRNKYRFPITIIFIIIILLSGLFIWKIKQTFHQTDPTTSLAFKRMPFPKEITVTLDTNGFMPNTVTIKVGNAVRWKNESGSQQTVNSDNYPTNQLHKELNFGVFNNGSSVFYTFNKPGEFGYHNQFHHEQKGKVIVTQ